MSDEAGNNLDPCAVEDAAIAGIFFSVLLITGLLLFRLSVRSDPLETGAWLKTSSNKVALALNLVPFAGIAFLWFIGVLRDRMGELEDRFFATVFLGSGLLFLAMLLPRPPWRAESSWLTPPGPKGCWISVTFTFARAVTYEIMNLYAVKMAAVFMISTSTLTIRTGFTPRWIAFLGFACALLTGFYWSCRCGCS